eukprot:Phypoly_transcript_16672.p1 GENE.Phypoly_transcript_16672~~Phypoly_transcript_16672.p1  ORF type:complete len:280 (+),score=40.94 Phypoly_transcript_16672:89-841(+)
MADQMLAKKLQLFKKTVDYKGFDINPKLWGKISPNVKKAIEILNAIKVTVNPLQKLECIRKAMGICSCEGADEEIPTMCYLLMMMSDSSDPPRWHAELDYISTMEPAASVLFAQGVLMYFATALLKKKNEVIYVDSVDSVVTHTVRDLHCLWSDIKKQPGALEQIERLYSMFLQCANNLTGKNQVVLEEKVEVLFNDYLAENHFMIKINRRIQLQYKSSRTTWTITHGEWVDNSSFAKIAAAFAELKLNK